MIELESVSRNGQLAFHLSLILAHANHPRRQIP
jgi:hypothetical protein